jgi:Rrf2 family cysteine metabolism transcriptional repressor
MKLSTRSRYGVRLMTRLAMNAGRGSTLMRDISRLEGISEKYLGQIIIPLRGAGLVAGRRGSGGGYTLTRPPAEVTVKDIVEVLEGEIAPVPCVGNLEACDRSGACAATEVWQRLADDMKKVLASYTLADLAKEAERKAVNGTEYSI